MEYSLRDGKGGKGYSFKEIKLNGVTIGIFQGTRGQNPDLDILIKFQQEGKRVRTPAHIHWVVDIPIKKERGYEINE